MAWGFLTRRYGWLALLVLPIRVKGVSRVQFMVKILDAAQRHTGGQRYAQQDI